MNPGNAEAYSLLADIYLAKKMYSEAADAAMKAYEIAKEEELKKREQAMIQQLWSEVYNEGIAKFKAYSTPPENRMLLDSALDMFNTGLKLRPKLADFYQFKGMVLEAKGDTGASFLTYKDYIHALQPQIAFARSKSIFMNMPRKKALQQLGKPTSSIPTVNEASDTNWVDIFNIDGREVYAFSAPSDAGTVLKYWKIEFSKDMLPNEKLMQFSFSFDPFLIVAQHYYKIQQLDSAFKYIQMITYLDPNNKDANSSLLSLYQEMGKTDFALKQAEEVTKVRPIK